MSNNVMAMVLAETLWAPVADEFESRIRATAYPTEHGQRHVLNAMKPLLDRLRVGQWPLSPSGLTSKGRQTVQTALSRITGQFIQTVKSVGVNDLVPTVPSLSWMGPAHRDSYMQIASISMAESLNVESLLRSVRSARVSEEMRAHARTLVGTDFLVAVSHVLTRHYGPFGTRTARIVDVIVTEYMALMSSGPHALAANDAYTEPYEQMLVALSLAMPLCKDATDPRTVVVLVGSPLGS